MTGPVDPLREAIHRSKDGCNGRPHTRWFRGPNKCDRLAALASPAAPRPEGLPDEEGVRNWPGGGSRVSKDALGEPRWSLDPDGAWVVLYAPRQFLDGLRPRLSDTGDTP